MKTSGAILAGQVAENKEKGLFSVRSKSLPTWCPGCGYFGIHHAVNLTLKQMDIPLHQTVVVSGIGCAGRYPFFSSTYGLHTVHGRALPVSTGIKLAEPELTVLAVGGDGDGLAIGGGHLPHIARRDVDVTYLLFDNSIYGLTKGQPSPSSLPGLKTKVSPGGSQEAALNATLMALSHGAGFVARLFAGNPGQISAILEAGIRHPGFSLLHIYTSCVTFDKQYKTWNRLKEQVHALPPEYEQRDRKQAMAHVLDDDFSTGIIYQRSETHKTTEDQ